jgi:hypothetical protein
MTNQPNQDMATQALDIIFKMCQDGRMDKEEGGLLVQIIFDGYLDEETFNMIKFMYKVRPDDELFPFGPLQVAPKIDYLDDLK